MTKSKRKKSVRIYDNPVYSPESHAVFRRSTECRRAHFSAIHPDFESACDEAVRLTANMAAEQPDKDHVYYVVRIEKLFSYVNGKFDVNGKFA